ncbi:MAG: heme-binding domain-containing protein [Planctomycetota bacterium]|jgi:hypothetical protein
MTETEQEVAARPRRLRKLLKIVLLLVVLAAVGIQFVPVARSNPPVTLEIDAPEAVLAVLRESCYDCHSNETRWPWYSRVAPFSWRIAEHVEHGREHVNFSEWDSYKSFQQKHWIGEAYEEAEEGHMPLPSYLWLHGDAALTADDLAVLKEWAESQ